MREPDQPSAGKTQSMIAGNKLVHLECARGIASIIVIFNHFSVGYMPNLKTPFYEGGLKFTPVYFALNGTGAVTFFFLLSGYVLTAGFFRNPAPVVLLRSVIKRLPRLMLPVALTIFAGLLILTFGSNHYEAAAAITGSAWLHEFGNANFPSDFAPSIQSAIKQCLYVFIFPNNFYYNSNLWTMRDEFAGSLVVFGISALYLYRRFRPAAVMIPVHGVLIVAGFFLHHAFVPFLVGSGLAYLMVVQQIGFAFSNRWTTGLLCAATMAFSVDNLPVVANLPSVAGSLLLMLALLGNAGLAEKLSGRTGALLGTLSFPLYLVHTLILVSLTSALVVYLTGLGVDHAAVLAAAFVFTLAATALFSIPLVSLESFWVPWLNRFMKDILALGASGSRAAPGSGADRR